jgi:AraC-like DNA-binding protein
VRVLFTTEDVPMVEGFPYWREQARALQMPFDLRCDQPDGFRAEMRCATLGKVGILSASSSACYSVQRTPALIRRSDPAEYRVVLVARGGAGAATARGQVSLGAGDLLVCDSSRPFDGWRTTTSGGTEWILLTFAREALPLPGKLVRQLVGDGLGLPGHQGLGALVAGFLRQASRDTDHYSSTDSTRLSATALDLVAALLAQTAEADTALPEHSRRTVLLSQIHAFVQDRLVDPDLGPGMIAAAHHISTRSLHKLFQAEDKTVTEWIRHTRLERCRRDLMNPALRHEPVHAVGARWGLGCPAQFSRTFRAAYHTSPQSYRQSQLAAMESSTRIVNHRAPSINDATPPDSPY